MKSDLSGLDSHASGVGNKIGTALAAGLVAGAVAVGGALAGSTKAFMSYEQSLANVSKTVDGSAADIKALGEANRQMSTDTGLAVNSLNGVSATLGSLGVAYKDIASTTALVAKGSIAFGMDAETMATQVSKISTVYKVPIEESGKFLSAMNALGNATAATEPQILDFTQQFGPMATMFNVPIEKVAAFGATLISSGVDASEGATSIRSALEYAMNGPDLKMDDATKAQIQEGADLIKKQYLDAGKSTAEASEAAKEYATAQKAAFNAANPGNTRMTEWAKLLGVDVKTLNQMLNRDFLGTMAKSSAALGKIKSSTDQSKKAFDIWGSYGFKVMGTMSSQAENLDANLKAVYADAESGSKSMGAEFERQNNTLQGSWSRVKAGINDVGITVGAITAGPVKGLFDAFIAGVPKIKEFIAALLSGDWDKVSSMMQSAFETGKNKVIEVLGNLGERIKSLPWPEWMKAAGEAIINAPWGEWAKKGIDLLAAGAKTAISAALKVGEWIYDKIKAWTDGGSPKKLGESIVDTIAGAIKGWLGSDKSIWESLKSVWGVASEWLSLGWEIIKGIGSGILGKISVYLAPAKNQFLDFVKDIGNSFYDLADVIASSIGGAIDEAGAAAARLVTWMGQNIPGVAAALSAVGIGTSSGTSATPQTSEEKYMENLAATQKQKQREALIASGHPDLANQIKWMKPLGYSVSFTDQELSGFAATNPLPAGGESSKPWDSAAMDRKYTGSQTATDQFENSVNKLTDTLKTDPDFEVVWKPLKTVLADGRTAWNDRIDGEKTHLVSLKMTTGLIRTEQLEAANKQINLFNVAAAFNANLARQAATDAASITKQAASNAANNEYLASKASESILVGGSTTAANAIRLGGEVSANFTTQAGQAVKIGLDASGREIAIIGQVAQKQWTDGGNVLYNKVMASGEQITSSSSTAGASIKAGGEASMSGGIYAGKAMSTGADSITTSTEGLAGALGTAAGALGSIAASIMGGKTSIFGGSGGSYTGGGNIGSATQTFNDCMFEGFTDTCTNMNINALKYTSPSGQVSYVNPMDNAAVRVLGGSGGGSSSGGGYRLPAGLMARGGNPTKPTLALIAERGEEMVLPNDITVGMKNLIASGGSPGNVNVSVYLDSRKMTDVVAKTIVSGARSKGFTQH
jgi:hypothetical protein